MASTHRRWAPWDPGRCFADVITLSGGCRDVGDSKLETVSSGNTKDHSGASTSVTLADGKTVGDPRTNSEGSNRKSLPATQKTPNGLFREHEGPQCCIYSFREHEGLQCCIYFCCTCRGRNGGRPQSWELIILYEPPRTHSRRMLGAVFASLHDRHHHADRCCYFFHIVFIINLLFVLPAEGRISTCMGGRGHRGLQRAGVHSGP